MISIILRRDKIFRLYSLLSRHSNRKKNKSRLYVIFQSLNQYVTYRSFGDLPTFINNSSRNLLHIENNLNRDKKQKSNSG